jgi:hypothetical protein
MSSTSKVRACSACDVQTEDFMMIKIGKKKTFFCQEHWAAFVDQIDPELLLTLMESRR